MYVNAFLKTIENMSCAFWLAEQAPSFHASLSCAQEVVHDSCDSLFAVSTLSPHAFLRPLNKRQKSPCSSGYVHKLSIILIDSNLCVKSESLHCWIADGEAKSAQLERELDAYKKSLQ